MIRPYEAPIDTIARSLEQAGGILDVLGGSYDDKEEEYNVTGPAIRGALWAVTDAVEEMKAALDKMLAERALIAEQA